jgi:hypothetical protein
MPIGATLGASEQLLDPLDEYPIHIPMGDISVE